MFGQDFFEMQKGRQSKWKPLYIDTETGSIKFHWCGKQTHKWTWRNCPEKCICYYIAAQQKYNT